MWNHGLVVIEAIQRGELRFYKDIRYVQAACIVFLGVAVAEEAEFCAGPHVRLGGKVFACPLIYNSVCGIIEAAYSIWDIAFHFFWTELQLNPERGFRNVRISYFRYVFRIV